MLHCEIGLLVFATLFVLCLGEEVSYHVKERKEAPVLLGNIHRDANLTDQSLQFTFFDQTDLNTAKFSIDRFSGDLSTQEELDREDLCPLLLTCVIDIEVSARSSDDRVFKLITVSIHVEDENDNAPRFAEKLLNLSISEGSITGQTFPLIPAVDDDTGGNNSVQSYELLNDFDTFGLVVDHKLDGGADVSLELIQTVNREHKSFYTLHVVAKDGGDPIQTGMLTVNVVIGDINDHTPVFHKSTYNVTVRENAEIGFLVVQVSAADEDINKNGDIEYKFSSRQTGEGKNFFSLNNVTGEIKVKQRLEYLPASASFEMVVEAKDHGEPRKSSQAKVILNILDTNNNAPSIKISVLTGTINALVSENASVGANIAHVEAEDGDSGSNGIVNCSIQSNHFRISPMQIINQYTIAISKPLDREKKGRYNLTVFCQDGGTPSLSSSHVFIVEVLDENDNIPQFSSSRFTASIYENNEKDDSVFQVTANDDDIGNNARIRYSLGSDAESKLYIETDTGIIHANTKFNYENETSFEFTVIGTDSTPPFNNASTRILLTILDKNDEYPVFAVPRFVFTVEENMSDNLQIGQLLASDRDEGGNQEISFYFHPQNKNIPPFSVLQNGSVVTLQAFDYENISSYSFFVVAVDGGSPPLNSTAEVKVTILDVNDNMPVFIFPDSEHMNSTIRVAHNSKPQNSVGRIEADDSDIGTNAKLTYLFVDGNSENFFQLHEDTGEIFLSRVLGVENIKSFNLIVSVHDNGIPQKTTQASLEMLVYLANTTTDVVIHEDSEAKNILIVVSISCVTFVLSTLLIILICIIKRVDERKKSYTSKAVEEMHVMETLSGNSNKSISSNGLQDIIILSDNKLMKKNKKEVSFSLEAEDHLPAYSDVLDEKVMTTFQPCPLVANQNQELHAARSAQEPVENERQQRQIHRMASLRLQQALLQSQNKPWSGPEENKQYLQFVKNLDDTQSQSSGETTTSDSGRGGSDEDVRSSGGGTSNIQESDEGQSRSSASLRTPCIVSNDSGLSPNSITKQPASSGFHRSNIILSSFGRNNNIRNTSSSAVLNKNLPLRHSIQKSNITDRDGFPTSKIVPFMFNRNQNISGSQRTSQNMNLVNSFDDTYSESAADTRDDDSDSTTTSGSYTIDPEDLCSEINELFFRPDASTIV